MNKVLARIRSKTLPDPVAAMEAIAAPAPPDGRAPTPLAGANHQSRFVTAGQDGAPAGCAELERLYAALDHITPDSAPRTFKLAQSSKRKISQKVIEEAGEVALEAVRHHASGVVRESADLLYHLVLLWRRAGVEPSEIWSEMRARADAFGIAEKLPKTIGRHAVAVRPKRSTSNR